MKFIVTFIVGSFKTFIKCAWWEKHAKILFILCPSIFTQWCGIYIEEFVILSMPQKPSPSYSSRNIYHDGQNNFGNVLTRIDWALFRIIKYRCYCSVFFSFLSSSLFSILLLYNIIAVVLIMFCGLPYYVIGCRCAGKWPWRKSTVHEKKFHIQTNIRAQRAITRQNCD